MFRFTTKNTLRTIKLILISVVFVLLAITQSPVLGATEQELRAQLKNQNSEIAKLEKEIAEYKQALTQTSTEKSSLQTELTRLELNKKKLESDVVLTKNKIALTAETIEILSTDIKLSQEGIEKNKAILAHSLRVLNLQDQHNNIATILLENNTISNFLSHIEKLKNINHEIKNNLLNLHQSKTNYEVKKNTSEKEYAELAKLEDKLIDQKVIVETNANQKNILLAETQNKEKTYQQLLADRLKKKNAVEAEIKKAEAALNLIVNPGSLPATGKGIIKWPLDEVIVTQYFGNTPFATANAQIYQGKGHNGIDLAAAVGTPVKAVLSGVVIGVGDTDTACKGASYGKWVMIKHPNGLSSVYAHLSLAKVTEGQTVATGDVVAYSGVSGYVTGPHLHFTLLATEGSQVGSLQSSVPGCGVYRLPLATREAVLNPLSYL
ncbi:MAG: peptidoglycan DD-metalloendopeptidase family protein [Candidatus Paceibacterota bacterium]